jgi:membrane protease YdiL (CAAX protease family)
MTDTIAPARVTRLAVIFVVLGFTLSWYPWVLHLVLHTGNGGPNPLGLLLAALATAAIDNGWRGAVAVLRSLVKVAAPLRIWAVALLLPAATLALAVVIARLGGIAIAAAPPNPSDLLDTFIIMTLFVGLGEEPAWRGFLLPLLQRARTPLAATLIVAAIWAVWHLPLMGTQFAWPLVPMFLISLLGAAFVQSWLYNISGGSSLLPLVMHGVLNTLGSGFVFRWVAANDLERFWWIYSLVWLAAGVGLTAITRGRLGLNRTGSTRSLRD